ncbi:uncharacterized protein [Antedon mediterranea]|uniref:uncharacterized protein n=1 Tax=Antedon mediterranea TaxID=105859 RepID=UPI003AF8CBBC
MANKDHTYESNIPKTKINSIRNPSETPSYTNTDTEDGHKNSNAYINTRGGDKNRRSANTGAKSNTTDENFNYQNDKGATYMDIPEKDIPVSAAYVNTSSTLGPVSHTYSLPVQQNSFSDKLNLTGTCEFRLYKSHASLHKPYTTHGDLIWDYKHVRQYGTNEGYFFMEVGRRSVTGEGTLMLEIRETKIGQEIVRNMKREIEKMSFDFYLRNKISGTTDISENTFTGEIIKTKLSKHLKLSGQIVLLVDITGISLQNATTGKMEYWWPFKNIVERNVKEKKFSFRGGKNSMAGEGTIELRTTEGQHIQTRLQHFEDLLVTKKQMLSVPGNGRNGSGQKLPEPQYQGLIFDENPQHTYQDLLLLPKSPTV